MRTHRARSDVMTQSERGERRYWKVPGLSKLRIGGSLGKATEKVKSTLNNTKVLGVPLGVALGSTQGLPSVIAAESSRSGGDPGRTAQNFGDDFVQGAKNLPLALGISHAGGSAGGVGDAASAAAGALGGGSGAGGGSGNILDLLLGGASAYNAANLAKKSEQYATGASDMALDNWKSREPLRMAGVQGMLNPQPSSDLSGLSQIAARSSPFAPKAKPPLVMGGGS